MAKVEDATGAKVYTIGKCKGCSAFAKLDDHVCKNCQSRFGVKCGRIMKKVRDDPNFALLCFRRLDNDAKRQKFVEMFGDPRAK